MIEKSLKFFPVLTGDIGGTNSRLEVISISKVILKFIRILTAQ